MLFTIGYQQFFPTLPDCVFQEVVRRYERLENIRSVDASFNPYSVKNTTLTSIFKKIYLRFLTLWKQIFIFKKIFVHYIYESIDS